MKRAPGPVAFSGSAGHADLLTGSIFRQSEMAMRRRLILLSQRRDPLVERWRRVAANTSKYCEIKIGLAYQRNTGPWPPALRKPMWKLISAKERPGKNLRSLAKLRPSIQNHLANLATFWGYRLSRTLRRNALLDRSLWIGQFTSSYPARHCVAASERDDTPKK